MGQYAVLARLRQHEADDETRPEPEPFVACGKTSDEAARRGWPQAPCLLRKGHTEMCDIRAL